METQFIKERLKHLHSLARQRLIVADNQEVVHEYEHVDA